MDQEVRDIELLDNYLEGTLSKADEDQVRKRLASDPVFASLLEDLKVMRKGIELSGMEKKLAELKEVDREMGVVNALEADTTTQKDPGNPPVSRSGKKGSRLFSIWSVAASVVVVLGAAFSLWKPWVNNDDQSFHSFLVPYEDIITIKSAESQDLWLTRAMEFYNRQDYKAAVNIFRSYYSPTIYSKYYIYYGISLLNEHKFKKALEIFEVVETNDASLEQISCYYKTLTYWGKEDVKKAIEQIETCPIDYGPFNKKIQELETLLDQLQK